MQSNSQQSAINPRVHVGYMHNPLKDSCVCGPCKYGQDGRLPGEAITAQKNLLIIIIGVA